MSAAEPRTPVPQGQWPYPGLRTPDLRFLWTVATLWEPEPRAHRNKDHARATEPQNPTGPVTKLWLAGPRNTQGQWPCQGDPVPETYTPPKTLPGTVQLGPARTRVAEEEPGTEPGRGGQELESALSRLPGSPGRIRPESASL